MTTATILSAVFNFIIHGDHTYKAIWTLDKGGHSELWVKDGDNHNTFAVVLIMTEYIVGHVLKAITYHHLLLKICTCGTIWGCTTIKSNHENKVICTRIVMHWATIWICATNRVNMVHIYNMLTWYYDVSVDVPGSSSVTWLSPTQLMYCLCILLNVNIMKSP